MANPLAVALHASAQRTAGGTGSSTDIAAIRSALRLTLEITDVTGTDSPSLTVIIETSPSNAGSWQQVAAFPAQTAVGSVDLILTGCRRYVRARWVITGTFGGGQGITFALAGEAHQLLATVAEATRLGIPAPALESLTAEEKAEELLRASDEVHDSIAAAYVPPITAWGSTVKGAVADLFVWYALCRRGVNLENELTLIEKKNDAKKWCELIRTGKIKPPEIVDSTPTTYEGGAFVVTRAARGW